MTPSTRVKLGPQMRQIARAAAHGELVVPLLRAALFDPNFKGFEIKIEGFQQRHPDGWFHPSSHPMWPERMLYYYLAEPERLIAEPFDPHSTMAVTAGTFWHKFVEHVGLEIGIFKNVEVYVEDPETGSRGHYDAEFAPEIVDGVFEFKTMMSAKARKIPKGPPDDPDVIAAFRKIAPEYYVQAMEYLRMSGYRHWRGLILSMEYPFPMREIALDYDYEVAYEIKEKYMRVRQAVADGRMPEPCDGCLPRSSMALECPARGICPVGMA